MEVKEDNYQSELKSHYNKTAIDLNFGRHYTLIDFNEVDMRIYLPEKVINSPRPLGKGEYHF